MNIKISRLGFFSVVSGLVACVGSENQKDWSIDLIDNECKTLTSWGGSSGGYSYYHYYNYAEYCLEFSNFEFSVFETENGLFVERMDIEVQDLYWGLEAFGAMSISSSEPAQYEIRFGMQTENNDFFEIKLDCQLTEEIQLDCFAGEEYGDLFDWHMVFEKPEDIYDDSIVGAWTLSFIEDNCLTYYYSTLETTNQGIFNTYSEDGISETIMPCPACEGYSVSYNYYCFDFSTFSFSTDNSMKLLKDTSKINVEFEVEGDSVSDKKEKFSLAEDVTLEEYGENKYQIKANLVSDENSLLQFVLNCNLTTGEDFSCVLESAELNGQDAKSITNTWEILFSERFSLFK